MDQHAVRCVALQLLTEDGMDVDLKAGLEFDLGDAGGTAKSEKHELLHLRLYALLLVLGMQCRAALPDFGNHVECEVLRKASKIAPAFALKAGGGTETEAEVGHRGPVTVVMSAFVARLRIVRDLVALVAVALRHLAGLRVDGGLCILRRKCQRAGLLHCPKRGAVLDDEVIDRDVLRLQHEYMAEGLSPGFLSLAGDLVDEVDVDVPEALHPRALIALQEVLEEVETAEGAELVVVGGLETDGQAVDAGVAVGCKFIRDGRGRIALDGDLGVWADGIEAADVIHDA